MKTSLRFRDNDAYFVITELGVGDNAIMKELYFQPIEGGFSKRFPANTPHLEQAFANFERDIELMVRQAAGDMPIDWETALQQLLQYMQQQDMHWYVVGSTALAVRGLHVKPRDIDIILEDEASMHRLSNLLERYIVEPLAQSEHWIARWFMRAFLHARIEFVGEVFPDFDNNAPSDFGPIAAQQLETVEWNGTLLRVPPIELMLTITEKRGLTARAQEIRRWLKSR